MRISILAIGRLGRGPEMQLVGDYIKRVNVAGRSLALGPAEVIELEPRRSGRLAEQQALLGALGIEGFGASPQAGLHILACDERGEARPSRLFAAELAGLRDEGVRRLALLIGGADGLSSAVLERAHSRLSFGPQTWPHALARVMLAEQLYRAASILAGGPYHRD